MWNALGNHRDTALLFFRLIFCPFFIWVHGWPNVWGKNGFTLSKLEGLGKAMQHFGIDFLPGLWGGLAVFSETICVILMLIGFWFRPACLVLLCTMVVASVKTLNEYGLREATHPIEIGMLLMLLMFVGAGKYSVDRG